jgi:hypothetical protein
MHRRTFLGLAGALATAGLAGFPARPAGAQADRALWWSPKPLELQRPVVLEWRYLAGRLSLDGAEIGIVVSVASYNEVRNPLTGQVLQQPRYELLVARQEFASGAHVSRVYSRPNTTPSYAAGVYSFAAGGAAATWGLAADGTYSLSVSSPELSLGGLTLRPLTPLVPEGGDGETTVAKFGPALVNSDYYNDWVAIERGGQLVGYGRLDIQTLRPTGIAAPTGFSHHWFALAARAGADEVLLSAYQLVSEQTYWYCTLGRRAPGGQWSVTPLSWESAGVAHPLAVQILAWQPQRNQDGSVSAPARRTGQRWRVTLGRAAPGDVLDLDLPVQPGQFLQGARIQGVIAGQAMQEAIGTTAAGLVAGVPLSDVRFTVAESTFSEPGEPLAPLPPPTYPPPANRPTIYLPLTRA